MNRPPKHSLSRYASLGLHYLDQQRTSFQLVFSEALERKLAKRSEEFQASGRNLSPEDAELEATRCVAEVMQEVEDTKAFKYASRHVQAEITRHLRHFVSESSYAALASVFLQHPSDSIRPKTTLRPVQPASLGHVQSHAPASLHPSQ